MSLNSRSSFVDGESLLIHPISCVLPILVVEIGKASCEVQLENDLSLVLLVRSSSKLTPPNLRGALRIVSSSKGTQQLELPCSIFRRVTWRWTRK